MSVLEAINYSDGALALTGLLARPAGRPRAAVAVYPTIMNPSRVVKEKAQQLAQEGFLALICDLYGETPDSHEHARALSWPFKESPALFRSRAKAGLRALDVLEGVAGLPKAAIGFCMGGRAVLELARMGEPLAAVASFHGLLDRLDGAEASPGSITARILVCHGDADELVSRAHVIDFWEEMDRAGANWHFHSYSGAPHSFTNPWEHDGVTPAVSYDASADRQSWAAMHGLFDEVFD